jgi:hypothetical protein
MAKRRGNKVNEARIQRAVNGLLIPMLQIPKLYHMLEELIFLHATDEQLKKAAHEFIYGKEEAA